MVAHGIFDPGFIATSLTWFHWSWSGDFTTIDLIAASTNALNGALLARRPDHFRNWTVVGIVLMAFFGGMGGGITRDVMLAHIPSALTNSAYFIVCLPALSAISLPTRAGSSSVRGSSSSRPHSRCPGMRSPAAWRQQKRGFRSSAS